MKAPITQAQAWAVIAESAGWNAKELPVLPDHPEPRIMKWSALEIEAIQAYGAACAAHAREMALSEAARVAADTVCDTHIPTGVKIYGSRAGKAIEALKGK